MIANNKKNEDSDTVTKKNNNMNNSEENYKNLEDKSNELCYENDSNRDKNSSFKINENEDENKFIFNRKKNMDIKANPQLNIFLLDIDGNVNYYNENEFKTLFNINKIKEIDKIARERGLFSLNYSYIIKFYNPYLAISTDNGCYIFQLKFI